MTTRTTITTTDTLKVTRRNGGGASTVCRRGGSVVGAPPTAGRRGANGPGACPTTNALLTLFLTIHSRRLNDDGALTAACVPGANARHLDVDRTSTPAPSVASVVMTSVCCLGIWGRRPPSRDNGAIRWTKDKMSSKFYYKINQTKLKWNEVKRNSRTVLFHFSSLHLCRFKRAFIVRITARWCQETVALRWPEAEVGVQHDEFVGQAPSLELVARRPRRLAQESLVQRQLSTRLGLAHVART